MEGPEIKFAEVTIDNGSFGTRTIRFETGRLARQAAGSSVVYLDEDTMILSATAVSNRPKDHFDFFPLTVDVEERQYAAGKIPGSFFRREGRPSTDAILACRLIDRPLRPAFVKGLRNEVQVVATVLAIHPDDSYDVVAINAASLSTQLSGLPFSGPIGGVRIAYVDGEWVAFPRYSEVERATFSMVVAGRVIGDDVAVMMVEAEATDNAWELIQGGAPKPTEEVVASGLDAAKPHIRALCEAQARIAAEAAKPTAEFPLYPEYAPEVYQVVEPKVRDAVAEAIKIVGKLERESRLEEIRAQVLGQIGQDFEGREGEISAAVRAVTKDQIRHRVLTEGTRIDGRGLKDIRTISAEVEVLPRVHGSA
nr:polyribonucleotide nucleotidyltransferase [Actinomycetales bacterium]